MTEAPTRLDLACGQRKREGYFGVDLAPTDDADLVHDLMSFPWPFDDDSVEEAYSSHYVEHTYPVGGPNDGLIAFMNELHRICRPDAKVQIIHPYALSTRAFQDPTHTRFIPETTWYYFSLEWRTEQGLDHYQQRLPSRMDVAVRRCTVLGGAALLERRHGSDRRPPGREGVARVPSAAVPWRDRSGLLYAVGNR
jgi:hypothetical protein